MRLVSIVAATFVVAACQPAVTETAAPEEPAADAALDTADETAGDPAIEAASRESPEAFVRALLSVYDDVTPPNEMRDNRAFYSGSTGALVAEDERLAADLGGVGYLGADPILGGQDWQNLSVEAATVTSTDADHAVVVAEIANGGGTYDRTYHLVRENGSWRIDDISADGEERLVAGLTRSIAEMRAEPGA